MELSGGHGGGGEGSPQKGGGGGKGHLRGDRKLSAPSCSKCGKSRPAYKCPSCTVKYCSANCCKEHKKICGVSAVESPPSSLSKNETGYLLSTAQEPGIYFQDDEEDEFEDDDQFPSEDTIPEDKLDEIQNDERVKQLLRSQNLRELITNLDTMQNPLYGFQETMRNAEFRTFSNLVLEICGVKQELFDN